MQGRLVEKHDSEEKGTVSQSSSWLFFIAQWMVNTRAINTTGVFLFGDLWSVMRSPDGTGIAKQVESAARHAKTHPSKLASLRFLHKKLHYIHPQYVPQIMAKEESIHGENVSGVFSTIFGGAEEGDNPFALPTGRKLTALRTSFQNHLYTENALTRLMNPMHQVADKYIKEIEKEEKSIPNVEQFAARYTMDTIAILLGLVDFAEEEQIAFSNIIDEVTIKMANPIHGVSGMAGKAIGFINKYLFQQKTIEELLVPARQLLSGLIQKEANKNSILSGDNWLKNVSMERERKRRHISDEDWAKALKEKSKIMIDVFNSSAIINALGLFLVVGHETTKTFTYFTIAELATHEDVVKKILDELNSYLIKKDPTGKYTVDHLTKNDLDQLIYLKAVMRESLRLHPPIPIMNGMFCQDVTIEGMGLLRKGDMFLISLLDTHCNEAVYPDALTFDPGRHIDENGELKKIVSGTFLPFGFERRKCVGQNFSQQELALWLLKALSRYSFKISGPNPKESLDAVPIIALKPLHKVSITATLRENDNENRNEMKRLQR